MVSNENGTMVMPVSPYYGGNGSNNGFGGDSWAWIILLLLLAGNGWGNNNGGFMGNSGTGSLYPWMNQAEITTNGFQNQLLNDNVTSIRDGVSNLSTQLCNCCGDMQMALATGFAGVEQGASARQMANMQQVYGIQSALQDCCCENRLAIAGLNATIASEECATRANDTQNTQAILNLVNSGIQSIKDQMCQDKIDQKNDEIGQLRQEILYARGQASQLAQNQQIVDSIYNRLDTCPVGTTPVFGRTPIFTCATNLNNGCGCGCGCNGGF